MCFKNYFVKLAVGLEPTNPCGTRLQIWGNCHYAIPAHLYGSRGTRTPKTFRPACFQDKFLIQPGYFQNKNIPCQTVTCSSCHHNKCVTPRTGMFLKSGSTELHRTCKLDAYRAIYYTRTATLLT